MENVGDHTGRNKKLVKFSYTICIHLFTVHNVIFYNESRELPQVSAHPWLEMCDLATFGNDVVSDEVFESVNVPVIMLTLTNLAS